MNQSTRRHISDNRHFHTLKYLSFENYESNYVNCCIHWLIAILFVRGWRRNGGCVSSYCSSVTAFNGDPSSKITKSSITSCPTHHYKTYSSFLAL